jgi:modification methylase
METTHLIHVSDSRKLQQIENESVNLVVTSPPYPMIEMWDTLFSMLSEDVKLGLAAENGMMAYNAMHAELDKVWSELARALAPGSFACINIGDATRTIGGRFRLYPNHARIIESFTSLGFDVMPFILWRKQTNAPNKFMGSGMLPAGAYVTLEHEYILIFRKGAKRNLGTDASKTRRNKSAFFWEERNKWFSDVWDFKGTRQILSVPELRGRSAAFPFELAYRLINMYSLYEDMVLDPFAGTGTTTLASLACGRNSISTEIDPAFPQLIIERACAFKESANEVLSERICSHQRFVTLREEIKGPLKHTNEPHSFKVVTRQETAIQLFGITSIERRETDVRVSYKPMAKIEGSAIERSSNKENKAEPWQGSLDFLNRT